MGRRARGILEYAKTITWYDYLFNEAKKLKELKIINEYQFYKFMYSNSIYSPEAKLFRKYKFGLSTPQKAWKKSTEELIPSAIDIIEHPIWNIENLEFNSDKVISEMHNLTLGIREHVICEGVYTPQPVSYSILKKIASFHDLDAMYAIYLLYQWGLIINNYELCNYCAEALEKNLETFLLNISYLHRSHIFLFDIIFDKIRKISYQGLTKAEVTNINWRLLRAKTWISDIRMNSYVSEYNLSKNAVISKKLENREIYISYSDSLILKAKIATDPNDLITLNFNDLFPSHIIFYIQKNKTENHN
ncbi:hypothetical protein KSB07_03105 [Acinetobacter junii]|uniref:hypothetical protein n=1 Tax=Acinetobacter junii TaxID=40215 RepID=UPI001F229EBF|nr:hypothetical protein [Acinetobacter junii]MCE6003352.1 hypothetical protein [Acinetobacter junii]